MQVQSAFLASHLCILLNFLFLFKNHFAETMKQNKEKRGTEPLGSSGGAGIMSQ